MPDNVRDRLANLVQKLKTYEEGTKQNAQPTKTPNPNTNAESNRNNPNKPKR